MMKPLGLKDAIKQAAAGVQKAALGTRYVATVHSVTDRETTGWVICDVFFRDPAADGRVTVRVNATVDLAANDLIYIKHDPAGQKNFVFDGFVKGGGTGNNDAGAFIPWTQAPGATSPTGMDYEIDPAPGQDVIVDGVNWSTFNALQFVLMTASAEVANERVLTAGDGISLTDGGAGGAATLAVDLVAAWSGLEFSAGDLRVDMDAAFDFLNDVSILGDLELHAVSGYNPNFILSSDAINQPAITINSADVFGALQILHATAGGLVLRGLSDMDATAVQIQGFIGASNPTDTTPVIMLRAYKSDGGTGHANLAAAETVLQIQNRFTDLITVKGDGDVGFGTPTPGYKIHAYNAGAVHIQATVENANSAYAAILQVRNDVSSQCEFIIYGTIAAGAARFGVARAGNAFFASNAGAFAIGTIGATNLTLGTNNTARMTITSAGNFGFRTTSQFGGGVGVLGIANAGTNPGSNPTGGGVLYVDGGALKYRGSSGTVTTIAAA